ncbi:MAG TPA: hypothetical protein DCS93_21675 [Microscillaceae bacterium]|nr:hypothetical protein [Microscillaceae bacterium]
MHSSHSFLKITRSVGWVMVIFLCVLGALAALNQMPPNPKSYSPEFAKHPITTLMHVVPGLLFMVLGPIQFMPKVRRKFPRIHRLSGYVFALSCVPIGISAIVITNWFPTGGIGEQISMTLFALAFLYYAYRGVYHIRQRQVIQHRACMLRVFAIGLAVAVFRVVMAVTYLGFGIGGLQYLDFKLTASFVVTWLVAEWWIKRTKITQKSKQMKPLRNYELLNDEL